MSPPSTTTNPLTPLKRALSPVEEEEDDDTFAPGPGPWELASNGRMADNFAFLAGIDSVPAAPIVPKKPKGKTSRPRCPWKTREDALIEMSKGGKDGKTPTKKHRVSTWLPADRDWAASDGEGEEEKAEVKEEKKEEEIEEKKDEVKDEERAAEKEKKDEAEEA